MPKSIYLVIFGKNLTLLLVYKNVLNLTSKD